MARNRKIGNLLALTALAHLARRPMHPYELSRALRDGGDARSVRFNHGSLYMVVQQLGRAGFLAEQETSRDGHRPERTVYTLTDAGRHELRDWLRELVEQPHHEYPHFVAALSLIEVLAPDEVVELLETRLGRLREQRTEIRDLIDTAVGGGLHPLSALEEDYRLSLVEAEMAFLERVTGQIAAGGPGWGARWAQRQAEPHAEPDTERPGGLAAGEGRQS